MSAERLFDVEVYGYDTVQLLAASTNKARYRAFLALREAVGGSLTFRDFLARGIHVAPSQLAR